MSIFDDFRALIDDGAVWLQDVIEGPLREWAQTDVGSTVLRAMASS